MAKILLTWECGAGLGHLTRYSGLVDRLLDAGHEVGFVVQNLSNAEKVYAGKDIQLFQAPLRLEESDQKVDSPKAYVHVLKNQGFANLEGLKGRLRAWRLLYELWQPDLMICDHSPTAVLASHLYAGAKVFLSGGGYVVPPTQHPISFLVDSQTGSLGDLIAEEGRLLSEYMNPCMRDLGGLSFDKLCDVFKSEVNWLHSVNEVDHYPNRDKGHYLGVASLPAQGSRPWPEGSGKKIFIYIHWSVQVESLLEALKKLNGPTFLYGLGQASAFEEKFSGPSFYFSKEPLDIESLLQGCDLAITNGNLNSTTQFLQGGVPVLTLPRHIEQLMTSKKVEELKCGLCVEPHEYMKVSFVELIRQLTEDGNSYKKNALSFAQRHPKDEFKNPTDVMFDQVKEFLKK